MEGPTAEAAASSVPARLRCRPGPRRELRPPLLLPVLAAPAVGVPPRPLEEDDDDDPDPLPLPPRPTPRREVPEDIPNFSSLLLPAFSRLKGFYRFDPLRYCSNMKHRLTVGTMGTMNDRQDTRSDYWWNSIILKPRLSDLAKHNRSQTALKTVSDICHKMTFIYKYKPY